MEQMRDRFAHFADSLGVSVGLAVPFIYYPALHDERITKPLIKAVLLFQTCAVNKQRAVQEKDHQPEFDCLLVQAKVEQDSD